MLKSFFSRPNILFRILVVLIFAGGLVFAGTYDGFFPKTQAENSSCCGGTDAASTDEPTAQAEANGCCGTAAQEVTLNNSETNKEVQPAASKCGGSCGYTSCQGAQCQCGNTSGTCSCSTSCTTTVCNQAKYGCNSDAGECANSTCCSQSTSS